MTVGALGDSITTAFNAASSADNPAHSWSTGDDTVGSHRSRIGRAFPGIAVKTVNAAVAGARSDALAAQVARLEGGIPDYVTLLIGANDLTDWLLNGEYGAQIQAFKRNVQDAVRRLVMANPRIMIVLSGLPDQSRVLVLALKSAGGAAANLISRLPPNLVGALQAGYVERWQRANAVLVEVAGAFPSNVRFIAKTPRVRFSPEHLSPLDFYHPSVAGQRLLAEVTWEQGWFP